MKTPTQIVEKHCKHQGYGNYTISGNEEGLIESIKKYGDERVSSECNTLLASGEVKGEGGPKNLRGDFRRLIQVHIDSYNHNAKDQYGFISDKAKYKLEAMESFLESAIKSNLVGEDF